MPKTERPISGSSGDFFVDLQLQQPKLQKKKTSQKTPRNVPVKRLPIENCVKCLSQ